MIKKSICIFTLISILFCSFLCSCGDSTSDVSDTEEEDILDLTSMSSTMVYAEVLNIMTNPDEYLGRKIKMNGPVASCVDEINGETYYACIIQDATACCAQGMEFQLQAGNYPEDDEEITVMGTWKTYTVEDSVFYSVMDATIC